MFVLSAQPDSYDTVLHNWRYTLSVHTHLQPRLTAAQQTPGQLPAYHKREGLLADFVQEMGVAIPRRKLILSTYLFF